MRASTAAVAALAACLATPAAAQDLPKRPEDMPQSLDEVLIVRKRDLCARRRERTQRLDVPLVLRDEIAQLRERGLVLAAAIRRQTLDPRFGHEPAHMGLADGANAG